MVSCIHRPSNVTHIKGDILLIDSGLDAMQDSTYLSELAPIKANLEVQLGAPIGYAPKALEVYKPECPMLNWASDAL